MTGARLKTLVVENFRSLRGKIVIPLDAQVVLIHGTNGMGKTSVLSALELGLTGKISHLAADGNGYRSYLTTLDTDGGSISLTTTAPHREDASVSGSLAFGDGAFKPNPLLDTHDARFFAERCYLPQATLGRLLEIYDDQKTTTTSPLTLFVKELLGLDPLDALVDGLYPAFNVSRVRNLVSEYRRLEDRRASFQSDIDRINLSIAEAVKLDYDRIVQLNQTLSDLSAEIPLVSEETDLTALRHQLYADREAESRLSELSRLRSEIKGLAERWRSLPADDASHDQAGKEQFEQAAAQALLAWRSSAAKPLEDAIGMVRMLFSDVVALDDGPEKSRMEALRRAQAEVSRCDQTLVANAAAVERIGILNAVVQRATARIQELDRDLVAGARDAKSIANALAGIAPHVEGDICPVCDRDFSEASAEPLTAHIAAKIAALTSEAGRLQALATERAEESTRLTTAQRDLLGAGTGRLGGEEVADLTVRKAQMVDAEQRLQHLQMVANEGVRLTAQAVRARELLLLSRRRDELSNSLMPEIESLVQTVLRRRASSFNDFNEALAEAGRAIDTRVTEAERLVSLRIRAVSDIDVRARELAQIEKLRTERARLATTLADIVKAVKQVDQSRECAKRISDSANKVRSDIVKAVFNTSLNKTWRDLFVRLAPSEQFVPAFKLPSGDVGKVEAVLETLHRSGKASGSPGAMLSQGNLNTAALTLFLALHLSVPVRMPWLILDDPVQSMDDVHTAQFAALLRTLSKGMNRQIVIAVHERALFDYLTLELSPAFPGDSLIAVEITRNFNGEAVATPRAFAFEEDRAFAA
ncbi:AAA family ATPase [Tardiphaga sp. 841_E9_N1_2]|uniref:AAA family ATPase n=1 Tax=Tardiphaga sp. 841_E9_N1_2 TaxID=3240762 RepID=UPI003F22D1B9